ncbi:MAG: hypothetical protein HY054_14160 [Proteobacteria bacterium]|nr:hypothetical protein [Pseudomonadota bacterium]
MAKDRSRVEDIADDMRDRAEEALERAQAAVEDGFDEAHRYLKRQWRERPVAVAAAALGAGVIIGLLIGSRR